MHRPRTRRPALALATAGLLAVAAVAGCSSDSSSSEGATVSSAAGSYEIVSDAEVAAGLADVQTLARSAVVALPTDQARAEQVVQQVYDRWEDFEGTIKRNAVESYLDLEDALGALKSGVEANDQAKAERGAAELETAAAAYLVAHPGGSATTGATGGASS